MLFLSIKVNLYEASAVGPNSCSLPVAAELQGRPISHLPTQAAPFPPGKRASTFMVPELMVLGRSSCCQSQMSCTRSQCLLETLRTSPPPVTGRCSAASMPNVSLTPRSPTGHLVILLRAHIARLGLVHRLHAMAGIFTFKLSAARSPMGLVRTSICSSGEDSSHFRTKKTSSSIRCGSLTGSTLHPPPQPLTS